MMLKRIFDIIFAFLGLILFFPLFIIFSLWIILDSRGSIFYKQIRVGKSNKDFYLFKFRTMSVNADKQGFLTIGEKDERITGAGRFLRKYKMDELPQLWNIFRGNMSFVGPRPEVRKYVDLYSDDQKTVLCVKPGLTDLASLEYINEDKILGESINPEKTYIEEILPAKLKLNQKYIRNMNIRMDCEILIKTISRIFQ